MPRVPGPADLGSIEPGKLADLVVVDGDPLADIRNARKVKTVIKDGQVFDMKALLDGGRRETNSAASMR